MQPSPTGSSNLALPGEVQSALATVDAHPTLASYTSAARAIQAWKSSMPSVRVALLATYTIDGLVPFLDVELARAGYAAEVYVAPFNNTRQELLDPGSGCARFKPDIVFLAQLMEDVCPSLVQDFLSMDGATQHDQVERLLAELHGTLRVFRQHSSAAVVVHTLPLPRFPALGILEPGIAQSQTALIRELNVQFAERLTSIPAVHVLDFDRLCAMVGYSRWRNEKMWYLGRAPLSADVLPLLARRQADFIQVLRGSPRKCLVLDLDNTIWGGVLGEDGIAGIKLGGNYPGNVYQDIQRAALNLYRRGILLAVNSKNNPAEVTAALQNHPDMVLREEHFAAARVNWNPKPQNMRELAQELNIGLDSLVFVDDNPVECEQMRQQLPEVMTICASDQRGNPDPLVLLQVLREASMFSRLALTDEDRQRGTMYRQQAERKRLEETAASPTEFLASLQMVADIQPANDFTMPRIKELIHKTNQFNLTTRRHDEATLDQFRRDPAAQVFSLGVRDRFGDNGLVGVAIVRVEGEAAILDTFLLSCRVIGRTVETALLSHLVEWARDRGARLFEGEFIPTAKNAPAADFFDRHGFEKRSTGNDDEATRWCLRLDNVPFSWPPYIATTAPAAAFTA